MKKLFSERFGYTKPSDVIIREQITLEVQNAICSCFDRLPDLFYKHKDFHSEAEIEYANLEKYLWVYFLNEREARFSDGSRRHIVATNFIENKSKQWYEKLNLLEVTIEYLRNYDKKNYHYTVATDFINLLNSAFEHLHFAYRIVNDEIIEINTKEEIQTLEQALNETPSNIKLHLNRALELYAQRPDGDYRNSIKESISAVEAFCRDKTGESTLGKALNHLEANGIVIPTMLRQAFEKLYIYTNQPDTGIRHALMEDTEIYTPKTEEAMFMLVSCSSFINYLNRKC